MSKRPRRSCTISNGEPPHVAQAHGHANDRAVTQAHLPRRRATLLPKSVCPNDQEWRAPPGATQAHHHSQTVRNGEPILVAYKPLEDRRSRTIRNDDPMSTKPLTIPERSGMATPPAPFAIPERSRMVSHPLVTQAHCHANDQTVAQATLSRRRATLSPNAKHIFPI